MQEVDLPFARGDVSSDQLRSHWMINPFIIHQPKVNRTATIRLYRTVALRRRYNNVPKTETPMVMRGITPSQNTAQLAG